MERVPEGVEQVAAEVEAFAQAGEAPLVSERFGEPRGELDILTAGGERLAGELDDL